MSFIRITIVPKAGPNAGEEQKFLYKRKTNAVEHAKCLEDFTVKTVHEKPNHYMFGTGAHALRGRIEKVLHRLDMQAKKDDKFDWKVEYVGEHEVGGNPAGPGSSHSSGLTGGKVFAKY